MDTMLMWFLAAGLLVALELTTGTFFLLMIALGAFAGGLMAWAGTGYFAQFVVAGAVAAVAVLLLRKTQWVRSRAARSSQNPDVNPDIGQQLNIDDWAGARRTRATYRGALWDIELSEQAKAISGYFTIVSVRGNVLIVDNANRGAGDSLDPGSDTVTSTSGGNPSYIP